MVWESKEKCLLFTLGWIELIDLKVPVGSQEDTNAISFKALVYVSHEHKGSLHSEQL